MMSNNAKRNSPFTTSTHAEPIDKNHPHTFNLNDDLSTGVQNISVNTTNGDNGANLTQKQFPLFNPHAIDINTVFSEDDEMTIKNITAANDNKDDDDDDAQINYQQHSAIVKTPYHVNEANERVGEEGAKVEAKQGRNLESESNKQRATEVENNDSTQAEEKSKETGKDEEEDDIEKYPKCAQCGRAVRHPQPPQTINGPLHPGCVMEYRFLHQPRCRYCDVRFRDEEAATFVKDPETGFLYHPECAENHKQGIEFTRPSIEGYVRKQGIARKRLTVRSWKTRYFILNPQQNGIKYYVSDPSGRTTAESAAAANAANNNDDNNNNNNNNNNSDSDNDNDEEMNNTGVVSEAERAANEKKLNKGSVPLDTRSRLITQPFMSLYSPISSMVPSPKELLIIFRESPESDVEHQLLFECQDAKDKHRWMRALETYIHVVDDPADYKYKPENKREAK